MAPPKLKKKGPGWHGDWKGHSKAAQKGIRNKEIKNIANETVNALTPVGKIRSGMKVVESTRKIANTLQPAKRRRY